MPLVATPWPEVRERRESGPMGDATGDAVAFARVRLGFYPDEVQEKLLRCRGRRVLLNCSRQWGKSTITAVRAMWHAVSRPGSTTLIVAPTERQSGELVRKVAPFVLRQGWKVRGDGLNRHSLVLPNGSRIVGLPQSPGGVRGVSAVSLLVVDEAARVSEEMYQSVKPMLATTDGDLWLLSTPHGRTGFFYEAWHHGGDEWERVKAPATECARISRSFLEQEKSGCPEFVFRQEYLCEFGDAADTVFDRELVEGAVTEDVKLPWT